ncbi:hypothetical protein BGX27_000219 [Mortierella sp. AM989]|nr:hypothetical protein BGX27_000219 [Mortierella sp. AM989]
MTVGNPNYNTPSDSSTSGRNYGSFKLSLPITQGIKNILREYPDGTQIARELLQNSDDAQSTVQWFLLDHRSHSSLQPDNMQNAALESANNPKLVHPELKEYMGPALIAGNDSIFQETDFESLGHPGASLKEDDIMKIGQMGIGFNSVYHMTDFPSFISGDQLLFLDPHSFIFNTAAQINFVREDGINWCPDQLSAFSALENIDFSKPYQGTVFRFPLRTENQMKKSKISDMAYSTQMVHEMLMKLKDEALNCLLFLKHVERIVIYERKEGDIQPVKLFEVEMMNTSEVREQRVKFLSKLTDHLDPQLSSDADNSATLDYTIWPEFRITEQDGTMKFEKWMITGMVGSAVKAREHMYTQHKVDITKNRMIPWVAIASPVARDAKINSRLFCFLPIGIQLPFPVHIHGHFAVKSSRREIWSNQDEDLSLHAQAKIKSLWNKYLFDEEIPRVYAKFLQSMGLNHGADYSLWPTSCGDGLGHGSFWKDLLHKVLGEILDSDNVVFFCKSRDKREQKVLPYSSIYIAGHDLDEYPIARNTLGDIVNLAVDLDNPILKTLKEFTESSQTECRVLTPSSVRGILRKFKDALNTTATHEARVKLLRYCIHDGAAADLDDLEGLPLLPLAGGSWVEFSSEQSKERYLTLAKTYQVLSDANAGLVDINIIDLDKFPFKRFKDMESGKYWSNISISLFTERVRGIYNQMFYTEGITLQRMQQPDDSFPTDQWLSDLWALVGSSKNPSYFLECMGGLHLIPITGNQLVPLSMESPALFDNSTEIDSYTTSPSSVVKILNEQFEWPLVRQDISLPYKTASDYLFLASDFSDILQVLGKIPSESLSLLEQTHRQTLCSYVAERTHLLQLDPGNESTKILRRLPIYRKYENNELVALEGAGIEGKNWGVAYRLSLADHPWLPDSINLLADEQPMRKYLGRQKPLCVPDVEEPEYWYNVLLGLTTAYSEDEWDDIMSKFSGRFYAFCNDGSRFKDLLRNVPFVRATGTKRDDKDKQMTKTMRLSPESVVHPSLSVYFMDDEIVFPGGVYEKDPSLRILSDIIGIQSKFDGKFIMDRLQVLFDPTRKDSIYQRKEVICAFYERLDREFSASMLTDELREAIKSTRWLLARNANSDVLGLFTPAECRPSSDACLVRTQMPIAILTFKESSLLRYTVWESEPSLDVVLSHFLSLINSTSPTVDKPTAFDDDEFKRIYSFLQESVSDKDALSKVKDAIGEHPWILIDGSLHTADRVAFNLEYCLYQHFKKISTTKFKGLFTALGVREQFEVEDLQDIITGIDAKYGQSDRLKEADEHLVVRLLEAIALHPSPTKSSNILVPTEEGRLRKISEVVYDDLKSHQNKREESTNTEDEGGTPVIFASQNIPRDLAEKLCIPLLSQRSWNDQNDNDFEVFEQNEDLVHRIRGILNDYDPSSIFCEFLQNAADAGATRCSFVLDQKSYDTNSLLGKEMSAWQGPALLIYNDAEFKEDDFAALLKLGHGNKGSDLSKIGRHGVGFNSVYHFTDVPSIVSGQYICYFDPLLQYLPKTQTPGGPRAVRGQRRNFLKLNNKTLADQLSPYMAEFDCTMDKSFRGTLFRIPLRTEASSGVLQRAWTVAEMRNLMEPWVEEAKSAMLFLNNMETIEVKHNGTFNWTVSKITRQLVEKPLTGTEGSGTAQIFSIKTTPTIHTDDNCPQWMVYTEDDFPKNTLALIEDAAKKGNWTPNRGVAIPLSLGVQKTPVIGKLFSHLPIPIDNGLSFHIHGVFALESNRKSLAGGIDAGNEKTLWNNFMLNECLPLTTAHAFEVLLRWLFRDVADGGPGLNEIASVIDGFFKLMPTGENYHKTDIYVKEFWKHSYSHCIFPCRINSIDRKILGRKGCDVVFPLPNTIPSETNFKIRRLLLDSGTIICECPDAIQDKIQMEWKGSMRHLRRVDETVVRELVRKNPQFVPGITEKGGKEWVMEFVLKVLLDKFSLFSVQLHSLVLLPLENGEWKSLDVSPGYHVAAPGMKPLLKGYGGLVNDNLFGTASLKKILQKLIANPAYGVSEITPAKFTQVIKKLHSPMSESIRVDIWQLLNNFDDLEPYDDLPILKTLQGNFLQLRMARSGLQITGMTFLQRGLVQSLMDLFFDFKIVTYDAMQNQNHKFFESTNPAPNNQQILRMIAKNAKRAKTRIITIDEARVLREMIGCSSMSELDNSLVKNLGKLRIWNSYGQDTDGQPVLICADSSYYLTSRFDISGLGDNARIIRDSYCQLFDGMGAQGLSIVDAARYFVLPKLSDETLVLKGDARSAYLRLLAQLVTHSNWSSAAITFLRSHNFILTQNGSLSPTNDLFDMDERLPAVVLSEQRYKFVDPDVWIILRIHKVALGFRGTSDIRVILECAEHLRALVADSQSLTSNNLLDRCTALSQHIFQDSRQDDLKKVDWMDPKWCFVPTRFRKAAPYGKFAPKLPEYLPFSKLKLWARREYCWTQVAFLSDNLKPSNDFWKVFPDFGKPNIKNVVDHLMVLANKVAPQWKTNEHQLSLKSSLLATYQFMEGMAAGNNASDIGMLENLLAKHEKVPYILIDLNKNPSKSESWLSPSQLVLGISEKIKDHHVVSDDLLKYENFLLAAGVKQFKKVDAHIEVEPERGIGAVEDHLLNCFETQDQHYGFMDTCFKFRCGRKILAHKFILSYSSDHYKRQFTGVWPVIRSGTDPSVHEIDLSGGDETYEVFWGFIYHLYSHHLIDTNGPPIFNSEVFGNTSKAVDIENAKMPTEEVGERVQYLMDLLQLADKYLAQRLKNLITNEMFEMQKVTYSNALDVREYAVRSHSDELANYCETLILENESLVRVHINEEISKRNGLLKDLQAGGSVDVKAIIQNEIADLEHNLEDLEDLLSEGEDEWVSE